MEHRAIDIEIPKLDTFIHKVYILLARKLYTNVYLYEENIPPLEQQRNNRELEVMIRECILEAVRDSIPIETILKAYLDKTVEENVETVVTTITPPEEETPSIETSQTGGSSASEVDVSPTGVASPTSVDVSTTRVASPTGVASPTSVDVSTTSFASPTRVASPTGVASPTAVDVSTTRVASPTAVDVSTTRVASPIKSLTFSNIDQTQNVDNTIENVHAPKDLTTLERISEENHARRMLEEAEGDDDMEDSINISNEDANIQLDIETL
jgi:hypothetical protein